MRHEMMFLVDLLFLAFVIIWMVAFAIYIGLHDRRIRRETGRLVGTADIPVGLTPDDFARDGTHSPAPHQSPRREFYKRIGLERGAEMKVRLYSLNDFESELEGDGDALQRDGFVAALKAYTIPEDEWLECSLRKAVDLLGLAPGGYEVDEKHKAILLRRLPHGFPACAGDCL